MYKGGICFSIHKSFGDLQLIPEVNGLRISYAPIAAASHSSSTTSEYLRPVDLPPASTVKLPVQKIASHDDRCLPFPPCTHSISSTPDGTLDMLLPIESIGGLWATAKAFLFGVESLDENVILQSDNASGDSDVLVKLYRDKPRGQQGRLAGDETCWLRIVTGRSEEERRRIKLGPRDLMCLELACSAVLQLAVQHGTHKPEKVAQDVSRAQPSQVVPDASLTDIRPTALRSSVG